MDLRVDTGLALPDGERLQVGASVWWPAEPADARLAWVCLAGGNMNRRYYQLGGDADAGGYSFAAAMTARGYVVIALDHLGLGDSSKPEDGWQLTPELLSRANAAATAELLARLREGRLDAAVPAMPSLATVGLGHSMGAMMTVLQQDLAPTHVGVALLGFSTRGLPEFAPEPLRDPASAQAMRPRIAEFARKMFGEPYPVIRARAGQNAALFGSARAEAEGVAALKAATDCILPIPAMLSMLAGNVSPEAARIAVPVFLGIGSHDMVGPPDDVPKAFSGSPDVRLHILPDTGHSHFLFASRRELFEALDRWARGLTHVDGASAPGVA